MVRLLEYLVALLIIVVASILGGIIGFIVALVLVGRLNGFMGPTPSPDSDTAIEEPITTESTPRRSYPTAMDTTPDSVRDMEKHLFERTDMLTIPQYMYLEYRAYLKSGTWKNLRKAVFKRDSHRCVRCGYIGPDKQVHHTHYNGIFELSFTEDQLETVCFECHEDIHKGHLPMAKD